MRVLVCGGRDYTDRARVWKLLDFNRAKITMIIHGAARGADSLAGEWAASQFAAGHCVIEWAFPANWQKHGKKAGFLRNQQMLDEAEPDLVVAFPGGKGTQMMVALAKKAGVRVIEVPLS